MSASPFVVHWIRALAARLPSPRRALDVAMGRGRHSLELARAGFTTFGVDVNADAVSAARDSAHREALDVLVWCADLTRYRFPANAFDLILVARYLQRDLLANLRDATRPGGFVVYETFTERQRELRTGPTSSDHLLRPGELATSFEDWEVMFYEETFGPEAVARLVARKPARALSAS